jgi:chemotaxis protein histidine kinase CheA
MKRFLLMLFVWALVYSSQGQKSALDYFQGLPEPQSSPCYSDTLSTRLYHEQLGRVNKPLGADIKARKKEVNDYMKGHKEEMKETMIKNSGLTFTPEQMQKMKQDNKHMTQEQKMKMADEMMQQNANISMKEVQARKADSEKKDTAALKRWSQAYATENMADQPADQAKIDAEKLKMKSLADISKELSDIQAKLNGGGGKFTKQLDLLQKDADSAWVELQRQIQPYLDEIAKISEAKARRMEAGAENEESSRETFEAIKKLQEEIHRLKYYYCEPLTSRYVEILNGLNQYLPGTFDDCDRMDELNVEINYRQTGVRMPVEAIGLSALLAVQNYAGLLGEIQKYRLVGQFEMEIKSEIGAESY